MNNTKSSLDIEFQKKEKLIKDLEEEGFIVNMQTILCRGNPHHTALYKTPNGLWYCPNCKGERPIEVRESKMFHFETWRLDDFIKITTGTVLEKEIQSRVEQKLRHIRDKFLEEQ